MSIRDPIVVGDTLDFVERIEGYPASDGWTLVYRLTPTFAGATPSITLTASVYDTDAYRIQADPTTTAAWVAGTYTWTRWVEQTGQRQSLESGRITLNPDPAAITAGYDGRTLAERALDDAETALATFSGSGGRVKSYSIAGRAMEFESASDILTIISYWRREVMTEKASGAKAAGRPDPRRIQIRMRNA